MDIAMSKSPKPHTQEKIAKPSSGPSAEKVHHSIPPLDSYCLKTSPLPRLLLLRLAMPISSIKLCSSNASVYHNIQTCWTTGCWRFSTRAILCPSFPHSLTWSHTTENTTAWVWKSDDNLGDRFLHLTTLVHGIKLWFSGLESPCQTTQLAWFLPFLYLLLCGAGQMSQWLRALNALPKVLSSTSSNNTVVHNHL